MPCPKCKKPTRVSGVFDDGKFGHICRTPGCGHSFHSTPTEVGRVVV